MRPPEATWGFHPFFSPCVFAVPRTPCERCNLQRRTSTRSYASWLGSSTRETLSSWRPEGLRFPPNQVVYPSPPHIFLHMVTMNFGELIMVLQTHKSGTVVNKVVLMIKLNHVWNKELFFYSQTKYLKCLFGKIRTKYFHSLSLVWFHFPWKLFIQSKIFRLQGTNKPRI